jgi:dTDP-4-amino-4,6-dideoxygalactose transaminase
MTTQHAGDQTIPFNKPFIAGRELYHIAQAVTLGNIAGDGAFTQKCCELMERKFGLRRVLLTPSCTAALEMAAMLCDVGPGDEVILPSYTFVSTANAFVRLGATPVFVDIRPDTLNLDETLIEEAITPRTKVIVPVHYAGVGCEMDRIGTIARQHGVRVVEDAAQGVHSYFNGRALGSFGAMGTYSFHETKNFICGEGGALCLNDPEFIERAEIIRDKGTNRRQFFRGQVDKYTWVDIGSSYVPSEICSAFLYGQLEAMDDISARRKRLYLYYRQHLKGLEAQSWLRLPRIPDDCDSNHHLFYILLRDERARNGLMAHLKSRGVHAVFHYIPLHTAPMGRRYGGHEGQLPVTENLAGRLLRLPLYYDLDEADQARVVAAVTEHLESDARRVAMAVPALTTHASESASQPDEEPVAAGV